MLKKSKEDYEGVYRIKRQPEQQKSHNLVSWNKIKNVIDRNGGKADFHQLSLVVEGHQHGTETATHSYQFITYCIKMGWLEKVK